MADKDNHQMKVLNVKTNGGLTAVKDGKFLTIKQLNNIVQWDNVYYTFISYRVYLK